MQYTLKNEMGITVDFEWDRLTTTLRTGTVVTGPGELNNDADYLVQASGVFFPVSPFEILPAEWIIVPIEYLNPISN
jgi:hypothetical protein